MVCQHLYGDYMKNLKSGSVTHGWLSAFIAVGRQLPYLCYMDAPIMRMNWWGLAPHRRVDFKDEALLLFNFATGDCQHNVKHLAPLEK